MNRRTYFFVLAVVCGFSVCGYCSVVSEVGWYGGVSPPSFEWIIIPDQPNITDIISFSGPTESFSNTCYAWQIYGGDPKLDVDHGSRTITVWFDGTGLPIPGPGDPCPAVMDPVCGIFGRFGPLEAGHWSLYGEYPLDLSIGFEVSDSLRLISPNGGESFLAGSTHIVSWEDSRDGSSCSGGYVVKYSTDGGQSWHLDFSIIFGGCSFEWTVPSVVSDQVVVRVCDSVDSTFCDISDGPFSISRCSDELGGDFNGDCYVNGYDYALFALWYDDNLAGISELAELVDGWLSCGDSSNPLCLD